MWKRPWRFRDFFMNECETNWTTIHRKLDSFMIFWSHINLPREYDTKHLQHDIIILSPSRVDTLCCMQKHATVRYVTGNPPKRKTLPNLCNYAKRKGHFKKVFCFNFLSSKTKQNKHTQNNTSKIKSSGKRIFNGLCVFAKLNNVSSLGEFPKSLSSLLLMLCIFS